MCLCMCYQKSPIAVNEHTIHFVSAQRRRAEIKTAAMSCNNGPERQEKKLFKESSLGILFQLYSIPPLPQTLINEPSLVSSFEPFLFLIFFCSYSSFSSGVYLFIFGAHESPDARETKDWRKYSGGEWREARTRP